MVKKKHIDKIQEACLVDYYLSANDSCCIDWDFRMQPTHEATDRYSENSKKYAVDSAIKKPELGNKDALDKAHSTNADCVLLCDFLPFEVYEKEVDYKTPRERVWKIEELKREYDNSFQASIDSVKRGMELAKEHEFSGEVWVPLQPPYEEMYRELNRPSKIAIGGIKDLEGGSKVEAVKEVNSFVDPGTYIHGLGFGATSEIVEFVRENPDVIDSIDSQTPMANANANVDVWKGDSRMIPTASYAEYLLLEGCRRMSYIPDEPEEEKSEIEGSLLDH